jgi:hypothetical protein
MGGSNVTVRGPRARQAGMALAVALAAVLSAVQPFDGRAFAAQTGGPPSPPADAPVMAAGLRIARPYGALEIATFSKSEKEETTEFAVELLVRNETGSSDTHFSANDSLRLVADGVPIAPYTTQDGCCGLDVKIESARYDGATFSARGRPRVVFLQIGTGDQGRTFLRWP